MGTVNVCAAAGDCTERDGAAGAGICIPDKECRARMQDVWENSVLFLLNLFCI